MIDGEGTDDRGLPPDAPINPKIDKQFWCSSDVESFRGFEYYRDGICRSFMDLIPEPEAHNEWSFHGSVETMPIGVGRLNRVVATSHLVRRTKAEIANSNEECFYLNYKTRGECQIHQSDHVSTLKSGDVGIFDSAIPFDLEHRRCPKLAVSSFMLPRQSIEDRMRGDLPRRPMILSRHPKLGALIRETASTLAQEADRISVAEGARMYDMLLDLVAMALSSNEEADSLPRTNRAHALLLAAKNYVDQNHFRGDMNPDVAAKALGISVRYLHKVFAENDASFAEYVLGRRLEAAASTLATSAFSHHSISEVSR
ncbi:MAG: hypothetical protein V7695_15750 [Sulfitobacter sp.]